MRNLLDYWTLIATFHCGFAVGCFLNIRSKSLNGFSGKLLIASWILRSFGRPCNITTIELGQTKFQNFKIEEIWVKSRYQEIVNRVHHQESVNVAKTGRCWITAAVAQIEPNWNPAETVPDDKSKPDDATMTLGDQVELVALHLLLKELRTNWRSDFVTDEAKLMPIALSAFALKPLGRYLELCFTFLLFGLFHSFKSMNWDLFLVTLGPDLNNGRQFLMKPRQSLFFRVLSFVQDWGCEPSWKDDLKDSLSMLSRFVQELEIIRMILVLFVLLRLFLLLQL